MIPQRDPLEQAKLKDHFKKYNIEDLSLQFFIMEFKIKNMQDKLIAYQQKIDKSYNVKYCIYNLIKEKQEIIECEKLKRKIKIEEVVESDDDTESDDDDDDTSIKLCDIKLLDTYSEEEISETD